MPQTPLSDHRDFRAQHELAGVDHNLTGTRNVLLLGRGVRSGAQERALNAYLGNMFLGAFFFLFLFSAH